VDMWRDGHFGSSAKEEDSLEEFFNYSVDYYVEDPVYDEEEVFLFVVGTEKKGYKDHHLLGPDAEYLGKFHTKHKELTLVKGTNEIYYVHRGAYSLLGELYLVSGKVLRELDEKYARHDRTEFDVVSEDGEEEEAWLYHASKPIPEAKDQTGIRVVNENYLEFLV